MNVHFFFFISIHSSDCMSEVYELWGVDAKKYGNECETASTFRGHWKAEILCLDIVVMQSGVKEMKKKYERRLGIWMK